MSDTAPKPETWLRVTGAGLYCEPGDFYVDPARAVARAVVTHGHADHARPGHDAVLATPATLAIMEARYGDRAGERRQALACGERIDLNGVSLRLVPAGHVLGSAQALLEWRGSRVVVSGDFKRRPDPTCDPFEVLPCDVFITEATFGLPVFRHPDDAQEIGKLLGSLGTFPERAHLVGVYALGKAQRVIALLRRAGYDRPLYLHGALQALFIALLRRAGYDRPLYLHGALQALCQLYEAQGVALGELRPVAGLDKQALKGEIVLAPPSALNDRWSRRLPDPVTAMASGWMGVRQRARQRGVELPLVISDHADWDELTRTLQEVAAPEVWVTHGNEEALVHHAKGRGIRARALALIGRGEEEQEQGVGS
jgi:putative mRNA 3-end processing factor